MKRQKLKVILIISIVVTVISIGAYWGWRQYQIKQEQTLQEQIRIREEQIQNLLNQVNELYARYDFDNIESIYDALDELNYDTNEQRKLFEYDRAVFPDAYAYYETINYVNEKLHSNDYTSLRALINGLITPTEKFEMLEINLDSRIGQYISNVQSSVMYEEFNYLYVNGTEFDLDYYLTSSMYGYIISVYTEELANIDFPTE